MPRYIIERDIPGLGGWTAKQLKAASEKSCCVLRELGPDVQWIHSYVTDDRLYCVYQASGEQIIREHAKRGGFPANRISEVHRIIDPTTADG